MDNELRAHSIALKTLKQRCEYLQQRLTNVEEENNKLKLEKAHDLGNKTDRLATSIDGFEKQIFLLNQQKSQMIHQIQMITAENQSLWAHLSKFIPGDYNVCQTLSVPVNEINHKELKFEQSKNNIQLSTIDNYLDNCGEKSFEEISLKLINKILIDKTELENQYSHTLNLPKDNALNWKNTFFLPTQFDNRANMNCIRVYTQKLKDFKEVLTKQKNGLSKAIINIRNLKKIPVVRSNSSNDLGNNNNNSNAILSNIANTNLKEDKANFTIPEERKINKQENSNSTEMICPMCGQTFVGKFTDFYQHVSNHFEEENEEYADATATFEVFP